jgi:Thioesterase-like superfamily
MTQPEGFYLPAADGSFDSTSATTSPWDDSLQHGGPPSALLARAIENCRPRSDLAVSRVTIDFLGSIPQGRMTVTAQVIRPGRRIELLEAQLFAAEQLVAVARAWRSQIGTDTAPRIPAIPSMPHLLPDAQPQNFFTGVDPDWGYGSAIEWRFASGSFNDLGPALVWARPMLPLVAGEQSGGLQRALIVADSANGLSAELDLAEWLFIPPGLSLTLYREPRDEWLLLDARTMIDSRGSGMTHATLFDQHGEFGVATQPLLVQRRSKP